MTLPADDVTWLALAAYYEARGEIADGKAAVCRVILNRAVRKPPYFSDGSVKGTILAPNQFSWTSWDFVKGHYVKVARNSLEELARVAELYGKALADHAAWDTCWGIAAQVKAGRYAGGAAYQKLGPDALLYDNLAVSQPSWATPDKLICQVGHHSFFRP